MTEIKHIINIYMALENYIEKLQKNGNEALEEDVQDTIDWLLEKKVTDKPIYLIFEKEELK